MTVAVEMATSSFSKLGGWLKVNTETAKDVQAVTKSEPNTQESIGSFRSRFCLLRQSLNEREHRLTAFKEDSNKVFSADVSPTNSVERLTCSPLLRRAQTDKKRTQAWHKMKDCDTRHTGSASALPSFELKIKQNSSLNESCLNKPKIGVTDLRTLRNTSDKNSGNNSKTDQQQYCMTDHKESVEFKTADKECTETLQQNHDTDLIATQDNNSIETNPARRKDRYDAGIMYNGSFSETNSGGVTAVHEVVRKCFSSRSYRQESKGNDFREEILNKYKRQDSGFYSEEECRKSSLKDRNNVFIQGEDSRVDEHDGRRGDTIDPYQMISNILNTERSETQSRRDPYRIIRRPSQKCTKNSLLLKQVEQERQANESCNNKDPKLKLSIQTFTSSKQIRVIVTEIAEIDELRSNNSKSEHSIQLRLTVGKMHHKICRKVTSSDFGDLREVFYFFDIDFDKLQNAELRIRLYDKQRYAVLFCRFPSL